jgi:hypothetical protein
MNIWSKTQPNSRPVSHNGRPASPALRLLISLLWLLGFSGAAWAHGMLPGKPLAAGNTVQAGSVSMLVTNLEAPGMGEGWAYVPALGESFPVRFENLRTDAVERLIAGTITAYAADFAPQRPEELERWLASANPVGALPRLLDAHAARHGIALAGHHLLLTGLHINPEGTFADLAFAAETPEAQLLVFRRRALPLVDGELDWCGLQLHLDEPIQTDDPEFPITIKGSMDDLDEASYVAFDCDGFQAFQLLCEYTFSRDKLIPVDPAKAHVVARFRITSVKLGEFIGTASIDPFEINGVDDVQFEVSGATVDYSTAANHPPMLGAIQAEWPQWLQNNYENSTWRGFFMESLSLKLPEGFGATTGNRIELAIRDLFYDHGAGLTGKVDASPNLQGNIEGWAISLATLALEVVANSPQKFEIQGGINIPIMEGTSSYIALIGFPPPPPPNSPPAPRRADISLTLTLDGAYSMPFLLDARLTMHSGSAASISYIAGRFQPTATLHGSLDIAIETPAIEFPSLTFEYLRINDQSVAMPAPSAGTVTGGLDKISVGAFALGGITLAGSGGSSGGGLAPPAQVEGLRSGASNQRLAGFPIYVQNIRFGSASENGRNFYKLGFEIGINFAAGTSAFHASGNFSIWGNLDYSRLLSSTPWQAISYEKTQVESIFIEADLGQIHIAGGLQIIDKDPVYGNGFKGAINMQVKLPSAQFMVRSVGQFGALTPALNGADYRYFFVDAEVGFPSGLPLGSTGLSIFGFSGGFFYNMEQEGPSAEAIAASLNPQDMPGNQMPELTAGLLTPGASLSGLIYRPREYVSSFKAGLIFGLSSPQTFLSDAAFGMEFNTANGFAVQRIFFEGGAYVMNPGLAQRQDGAIVSRLRLVFDLNNAELVGNLGAQVASPLAPAAPLISGTYNMGLSFVNIYFKFTGSRDYFFYAGTPQEPMSIRYQLADGMSLGGVKAYFMVGTQMPALPTMTEIFDQEGFVLPSEIRSFAGRRLMTGDRGVAFGARLSIPRQSFSFMMFSASLQAMAGFDASLMHFNQTPSCGSGGSFGMNNWYIQGQAYGAFYGRLDMRIDLFFYTGTVKIAELEVGAGLQAQLPNPTWMMGFLYGRYSVLSNRVRGSFSFRVQVGKQCADLPPYNPVASIPLIKDTQPEDYGTLEVYESPAATFFVPMGQQLSLAVPRNDGREEIRTYQCYIKEMKLTKKGSTQAIPASIVYQDSFYTALLQPEDLLEPQTEYELTIRVSWHEWRGNLPHPNDAEESKTINFTTGDTPNRIVRQAVGYHAPGYRQRYWHKGYAKPMLEFRQNGWSNLFPSSKSVTFEVNDQATAQSFHAQGWTMTPTITGRWALSKNMPLKYVLRLTNTRTGDIIVRDLNGYPGMDARFELAYVAEKGFADGFSNLFTVKYVNFTTSNGKQVQFDALNELDLVKGDIYHAEIVRQPTEAVRLPVNTVEVEESYSSVAPDGTIAMTMETSGREITPLAGMEASILNALGEDVLYNNYHFGISRYNSLNHKFEATVYSNAHTGMYRSDYGHPDTRLLNVRWGFSSVDAYYSFRNTTEPFDAFDQIKIRANLGLVTSGNAANPMREHVFSQRGNGAPIRLPFLIFSTLRESSFQVRPAPYDLYHPFVKKSSRSWNWSKARYETRTWEERISDRAGVFVYSNGLPSFWYDLSGWKLNEEQSRNNTRIAYQQWQNFVNAVARDYMQVPDWPMQVHFNTVYPTALRQDEIDNKRMLAWEQANWSFFKAPGNHNFYEGNHTLFIQDLQPRILRNTLQYYQYNGYFVYLIQWSSSKIFIGEPLYRPAYEALRQYYTRGLQQSRSGVYYVFNNNPTWSGTWRDAYQAAGMGNRQFAVRLSAPSGTPQYMHSRVNGAGNVKTMSLFMNPYILDTQ